MNSNFQQFKVNSLMSMTVNSFGKLFSLLIYVVIAKVWGSQTLGEFSLIIVIGGVLSMLSDFGLGSLLTKDISEKKSFSSSVIWFSLIAKFLLFSLFSICLFIIAPLFNIQLSFLELILLGTCGVLSLVESLFIVFRGIHELKNIGFLDIFHKVVSFIGLMVLVFLEREYSLFLKFYFCNTVLVFFFLFVWTQSKFNFINKSTLVDIFNIKSKWLQIRSYFNRALPLGVLLILINIYDKIDLFVIQFFHGTNEIGFYIVVIKFYEMMKILYDGLMKAYLPFLSSLRIRSKSNYHSFVNQSASLFVFCGLFILVLCFPFTKSVLHFFFGEEFIISSKALKVILFIFPILGLNYLFHTILIIEERQWSITRGAFFAACFNLVLNLIFVPKYSFTGAAATTLVTEWLLASYFIYCMIHFDVLRVSQTVFRSSFYWILPVMLLVVLPIPQLVFVITSCLWGGYAVLNQVRRLKNFI